MLSLGITAAGDPQVILQPTSPMVYADHWALRAFAQDLDLTARLAEVLHGRSGTLAISWMNFGEYSTVADDEQRRQVERFLDTILPALYCLDVTPVFVEAREQAGDSMPQSDMALALTFVNSHELRVITAAGLFQRLHDSRLVESKRGMAAKIHERFQELQRQASEDEHFRKDIKRADSNAETMASTPTRILMRTLVGVLIEDARTNITPNDAIDFLHTTVPVAHCDAVLLDGRWYDYVERARRKLDGRVKMAATFSARDDGIDRLLAYLEGRD